MDKQLSLEADYYLLLDLISKLKPKAKEIKYNVSFIYSIAGNYTTKNETSLPLYQFYTNGIKESLFTKDITKDSLNKTIHEYIYHFNRLGYKSVTIEKTKYHI